MIQCPRCGNQLNYIEQYKQWYCFNCQAYQQPQQSMNPPQQHPPPLPQYYQSQIRPKKTPLLIGGLVTIVVIAIIVATIGLVGISGKTITYAEYLEATDGFTTSSAYDIKGYGVGDKIVIEDTVTEITISDWSSYFHNVRWLITFASALDDSLIVWDPDIAPPLEGNRLQITLHVIDYNLGGYDVGEQCREWETYAGVSIVTDQLSGSDCIEVLG